MNKEWIELSKTLNKVIDYRGKTPKKLGFEWSETGYRALSALNVKTNGLENLDSIKYASEELYKKWMKEEIQRGDILLTSEAPAGQVMVWDSDEKIVLSQRLFALRLNSEYDNYFIKYFLQSDIGQKEINKNTTGSTVFGISAKMFDLIKVPKIKKERQVLIGKILKSLDAKIELNNKVNRELEAMAKTLYDYWFVLFDFPDANGRPYKSSGGKMVYNAELKREIPEGWEVKKLGDIIKKYADKSTHIESKNILNEGSYPVITQDNGDLISGFTNENNPIEDVPLIVFGDHSCTLRYIDFPFFRGADGTQIMYFEEDLTIYVYLFLQMIITQIPGYGKYERHYKYLKEFNIIIPKAKFLSEFQKIVEPIFNKISKSRLQNQHLTTLRDWLLPMLMNGQVTVKEAEEKLSMAAEPSVKYGN